MDNFMWNFRYKKNILDTIELCINDEEKRFDLPLDFLWRRRKEILKDILELQMVNYKK